MNGLQTTVFAASAVLACSLAAVAAPERPAAKKPTAAPAAEGTVDPKEIWPASLSGIAGRYVFAQVASPGGFWEVVTDAAGKEQRRQVSINEIPAALREKLLKAELIITGKNGPRKLQATKRTSPSKRGQLRFYEEQALGSVTVRNLPGIQGKDDAPDFSGPVLLHLDHQSHSNPSVFGVLSVRKQQEQTWGAATLDFADLMASTLPKDETDEGETIINNARVLRSGTEIFAYVEWREKEGAVTRDVKGAVRLERVVNDPAAARPAERAAR